MLDKSTIATILGLGVAVVALFGIKLSKDTKENFLGNLPSFKTKISRSIGTEKGDFYSVPAQYESILSPRMSGGVDYGANIRYSLPAYEHRAVPHDPLAMSDLAQKRVVEEYKTGGGCKPSGCCKPPKTMDLGDRVGPNYSAGNFQQVTDEIYSGGQQTDSMLPIGDMTTVNSLGEIVQPIVYDRYIYANRNSRLRGLGDPIRGDLPIVPCNSEWFRPSVHPQIDLHEGAMNVIGGVSNGTNQKLTDLMYRASGGADTTLGGVNMSNQFQTQLSGGRGDIAVTAFP